VAVAVAAIMVTQLAGYQELVLVLVLMVLSTIIMEVTAVLALLAMLCCHHNNTRPRLAIFSLCDTLVIIFSYYYAFLELPCHSVFQ